MFRNLGQPGRVMGWLGPVAMLAICPALFPSALAQEASSEDPAVVDAPDGTAPPSAPPSAPPPATAPFVDPRFVYAAPIAFPADQVGVSEQLFAEAELDVDSEGRVRSVTLTSLTGRPGVDAAIVEALRASRLQPFRDASGEPSGVTIALPVVVDGARVPSLALDGETWEAGSRTRLSELEVRAVDAQGNIAYAVSDSEGRYSFYDLRPGDWTILAGGRRGLVELKVSVKILEGVVVGVPLRVVRERPWENAQDVETIEVVGVAQKPEITERVLKSDQIRYMPGTSGDVVRAIQNFPGVARPPLNIGQLIIRGTAPEDSAYYVDGVRIPIAFHFAGLSTVINGDFLKSVSFLPGNYGVRYGRAIGGAVDLQTDTALPERNEGYLSVDLYQATAFVKQRVNKRTAISFSGRRSYIDAVLTPVLSNSSTSFRAPSYLDLQARVVHESPKFGRFDALLFGSDDRFRIVRGKDAEEDEGQVRFALATSFAKARLAWQKSLADRWKSEMSVILGPDANTYEIAPAGEAYEKNFVIGVREEIQRRLGDESPWGLRFGIDSQANRFSFLYDVPRFGKREDAVGWALMPGLYAEPTVRVAGAELTFGARLDGMLIPNVTQIWNVDPRFSVRAPLGLAWKAKASLGQYSQFPIPRELIPESDGTANLAAIHSRQASLGAEVDVGGGLTGEVNGFYADLDKLVVGRQDRFQFFTGPPPRGPFDTGAYANEGSGQIYGVEALGRYDGTRLQAWLAATWSRSWRVSRVQEEPRLFIYDQPVVVNAIASYQLPRNWRIGGRIRYGSGNPYTPVANRYYDLDSRRFFPVYGETDSGRLPAFTSLDLRFDKEITYDRWKLALYLDLQNVTNRMNPEVMSWSFDYSKEEPVTSTPVLPIIGARGSF